MRPDIDLNDLISHRSAWRAALADCLKRCEDSGDETNASYWRHELVAFDRTFSIFGGDQDVELAADIPENLRDVLCDFPAMNAYRLLIKDGFTLGAVPGGGWYWIAPAGDEPLTAEQIEAMGELSPRGFAAV